VQLFYSKKLYFIFLIVWLLNACGGGAGGDTQSSENAQEPLSEQTQKEIVIYNTGQTFTIQKGQTLVAQSEGTTFTSITDASNAQTNITVTNGSIKVE
jgi:hypothetical protein